MARGINNNFRAQIRFDQQKFNADLSPRIDQGIGRMKLPAYGSQAGFLDLRIFNGKGLLTAMTLGALTAEVAYKLEVSPFVQGNIADSYFAYEYVVPMLIGAAIGIPFTLFTSLLFSPKKAASKIDQKPEPVANQEPAMDMTAESVIPASDVLPTRVSPRPAPVSEPPTRQVVPQQSAPVSTPPTRPFILRVAEPVTTVDSISPTRADTGTIGSADIIVPNGYSRRREDQIRQTTAEIESSIIRKAALAFNREEFGKKLSGDGKNYSRIPGHAQYRILGPLGKGGMGMIILAYDELLTRYVVIKKPNAQNQDIIDRFFQEAVALAKAGKNNNNIMSIYGAIKQPALFIAELIEGVTLSEFTKKHSVTPAEAMVIAMYILKALKAAHDQGVIHRDLKPANIMFTKEGILKLVDFGLAKDVSGSSNNTATGGVMGTPDYMAPENFKIGTKSVDEKADMYSIGIILYFLIKRETPRKFNKMDERVGLLEAIRVANAAEEKAIPDAGGIPAPIADFLDILTAKEPSQRPKDYDEALLLANRAFNEII